MACCRICDGPLPSGKKSLCGEVCRRRAKTDWQLSWQKENPGKHSGYVALTRERNGPQIKSKKLLARYGITQEQFDSMLLAQDGLCAICKGPPGSRAFHVDHDHACCSGAKSCGGCVRGLLCFGCNAGLGMFRDEPERLLSAIEYLKGR